MQVLKEKKSLSICICSAGYKGEVGPQGLQGEKGDMGPQGYNGIPGMKGDSGPVGPQGRITNVLFYGIYRRASLY